jgi:Ino eighty subunit 2
MDTINRLLKKQAPKRRRRMDMMLAEGSEDEDGNPTLPRPPAAFVRYVQNSDGSRLGVPREWINGPAAEILKDGNANTAGTAKRPWTGKMVEEID